LTRRSATGDIVIRVASNERYSWRFPGARTERGPLPTGDYALMDEDKIMAVVERKTFDNLLADFGAMPVLHQRLAELVTYEHHALVIEALYADFLNPRKVKYYTSAFCARVIGELYVLHPRLRIVFCANRKMANEWTRNYFYAVWQQVNQPLTSIMNSTCREP
jgi:hypothetical protein